MSKVVVLNEEGLRDLIEQVMNEDMNPGRRPASASLPQKGALHRFKANVNMMADASSRARDAVESANTKEALRWLDKVISFATSARDSLKSG